MTLYFYENGRLAFEQAGPSPSSRFDEYISDPARPAPYMSLIVEHRPAEDTVEDQRFAATGPLAG